MTANAEGKIDRQQFADADELLKFVNLEGWNDYHLEIRGNRLTGALNGHTTFEVIDNDSKLFLPSGRLALQLHQGSSYQVQYKDIYLKRISGRQK